MVNIVWSCTNLCWKMHSESTAFTITSVSHKIRFSPSCCFFSRKYQWVDVSEARLHTDECSCFCFCLKNAVRRRHVFRALSAITIGVSVHSFLEGGRVGSGAHSSIPQHTHTRRQVRSQGWTNAVCQDGRCCRNVKPRGTACFSRGSLLVAFNHFICPGNFDSHD